MPYINIQEKDLTTVLSDNLTNNIAYVPGYAIMGPIETPMLFTSVEEFQNVFGYLPYKHKTDCTATQDINGTQKSVIIATAGSYEVSYIYALDLLRNGLPVLFERIEACDSIVDKWTAKASITGSGSGSISLQAKNPGQYGENLFYTVTTSLENQNWLDVRVELRKNEAIGIYKAQDSGVISVSTNPEDSNYWTHIENDLFEITDAQTFDTIGTVNTTGNFVYDFSDSEFKLDTFYSRLKSGAIEKLTDKNEYQIKFITAGGYPTFEIADNSLLYLAMEVAASRGDAVALIDFVNDKERKLVGTNDSLYECVQKIEARFTTGDIAEDIRKYGAMFAGWATYKSIVLNSINVLPGSFAYLASLAESIKTNENWAAVAGTSRGLVPHLVAPIQNITGAIGLAFQNESGVSINPIQNIKPYGYCIWGNRTLFQDKGLVASSFLNIRALSNDVKKVVYAAAKKLTFELNSDVLWLNFKAEVEPTLDKMVSGNGLSGYKILKKTSTKRATLEAVIRLFVIEAVENWDITIELSDTIVSVQ